MTNNALQFPTAGGFRYQFNNEVFEQRWRVGPNGLMFDEPIQINLSDLEDVTEAPEDYDVNSKASRGLGDTTKLLLQKMGIKNQCGGCKKRQAALNKLVPYKEKNEKNEG